MQTPLFIGGGISAALGPVLDIASFLLDTVNAIATGDIEFLINTFTSIILLPFNLVMFLFYRLAIFITDGAYTLMVGLTVYTPFPKASDGDPAIFAEPAADDTFSGIYTTLEESVIPIAILLVIVGIVILLFVRVFDVVIELSFDTAGAQKRLVLAPILISLWIPLANIVLLLASGLTDLFLSIDVDLTDYPSDQIPPGIDADSGSIKPTDIVDSGVTGSSDPESGDVTAFLTGFGDSGGFGTFLRLTLGLIVSIGMIPVALFVAGLAVLRIVLLYIFYTLGPIGIMMWAISWRDIGKLGEKLVRFFVLFALFPVPAALMVVLMPVLAIGIEEAITTGIDEAVSQGVLDQSTSNGNAQSSNGNTQSSNGNAQSSGGQVLASAETLQSGGSNGGGSGSPGSFINYETLGRIFIGFVVLAVIGFAPWALIIGISGATKAAAGSVALGTGIGAVGAAKTASSTAKGASKAADKASSFAEESDNRAVGAAASMGSSVKSAGGSVKSAAGKSSTLSAAKGAVDDYDMDMGTAMGTAAGTASGVFAAAGMNNVASGVNNARNYGRKAKQKKDKVKSAKKSFDERRDEEGTKNDERELAEKLDEDISADEMELLSRAIGEDIDKSESIRFAQRSDKVSFDAEDIEDMYEENGRLTERAERIMGGAMMKHAEEADSYEDLEEDLGSDVAESTKDSVRSEMDRKTMLRQAEKSQNVSVADVAEEGIYSEIDKYEESDSDVDGENTVTKEKRWLLAEDPDFDEQKAKQAENEFDRESENIIKDTVRQAIQENNNLTRANANVNKFVRNHSDEIETAYKNDNLYKIQKMLNDMSESDRKDYFGTKDLNELERLGIGVEFESAVEKRINNQEQIKKLYQQDLSKEELENMQENRYDRRMDYDENNKKLTFDFSSLPKEMVGSRVDSDTLELAFVSQDLEGRSRPDFENSLDEELEKMESNLKQTKAFQRALDDNTQLTEQQALRKVKQNIRSQVGSQVDAMDEDEMRTIYSFAQDAKDSKLRELGLKRGLDNSSNFEDFDRRVNEFDNFNNLRQAAAEAKLNQTLSLANIRGAPNEQKVHNKIKQMNKNKIREVLMITNDYEKGDEQRLENELKRLNLM